jgi:hypothetical protein
VAGIPVVNFYSGEKFTGNKTVENSRCRCGAQPELAYQMMDPVRGLTVRMFKCRCGEQRWTEDKD